LKPSNRKETGDSLQEETNQKRSVKEVRQGKANMNRTNDGERTAIKETSDQETEEGKQTTI
jgi:hypothetical protein